MQQPPLAPQPVSRSKPLQIVLGCFGLILLACIGLVVVSKAFGPGDGGSHDWTAIYAARDAVKARLVSPGSAKFPSGLSRIAARTSDGKYLVAYVATDSQNRFGALLRSESLVLVGDRQDRVDVLHVETFDKNPTPADLKKLTEEVGDGWQIEKWVQ